MHALIDNNFISTHSHCALNPNISHIDGFNSDDKLLFNPFELNRPEGGERDDVPFNIFVCKSLVCLGNANLLNECRSSVSLNRINEHSMSIVIDRS